jgi:rhodanese-related sulfurtransferase
MGVMEPVHVRVISADEVRDDDLLLDVREDDEWAEGRAPGAVHLPLGEVVARVGELPADRRIAVVCRVGGRSAQAAAFLTVQGLDAVNVDGGMLAWQAAGRPLEGDVDRPVVR